MNGVPTQVLVVLGLVMVGFTIFSPPYFGPAGTDDGSTLLQSGANRLRCSVDLAVLWVYVCSLIATILADQDDTAGAHSACCHRAKPLAEAENFST